MNESNEPSVLQPTHETYMRDAIREAEKALKLDEVPVGAIVVCNNRIIARGYNLTQQLNDVTAHAEMQAITAAANWLGGKYLHECSLYITLEPCVMCAGALYWAQPAKIIFGAADPKRGFSLHGNLLHPKTELISGVMEEECSKIIKEFFKLKR
jgi:tRNA(adenine34) deaminase